MRILFMGTPDFAVASLKALMEAGHEICGVFTQPDKPKNRGHKITFSPVKEYALSQGLEVYQPLKMRDGEALSIVEKLSPELIVVAAYGKILPEDILNAPRFGSINVHSSVLPKYRGAAPINWAILNGDTETGVTIMYMAKELDAGDIICCAKTAIEPDEDALKLTTRLADLGADALLDAIVSIGNGTVMRIPQDNEASSYAPMLDRDLSPMDFHKPAQTLHNQVRGLIPWPCATADVKGNHLKVYSTRIAGETSAEPGSVLAADKNGITIACGDGRALQLLEVQAEGGKRMAAGAFLAGHPMKAGV